MKQVYCVMELLYCSCIPLIHIVNKLWSFTSIEMLAVSFTRARGERRGEQCKFLFFPWITVIIIMYTPIDNLYCVVWCLLCSLMNRVEIREPTHPQPATVTTKLPNKSTVRTSDVRVSERISQTAVTLKLFQTVFNELTDEVCICKSIKDFLICS